MQKLVGVGPTQTVLNGLQSTKVKTALAEIHEQSQVSKKYDRYYVDLNT